MQRHKIQAIANQSRAYNRELFSLDISCVLSDNVASFDFHEKL
jgi:hypothetical protein